MRKILKLSLLMLLASVVLMGCISIPLGDGNKMDISTDGLVFTDEEGDETSISLDEDEGQISVSGGKEGEETGMSFGMNVEVHEDFPKDIPFPDDAMIVQSMKLEDSNSTSVMLMTNMEFEEVASLYNDFVDQAFDEKDTLLQEGNIYEEAGMDLENIMGKRADGHININITYDEEDEQTGNKEEYKGMVMMSYSKDVEEE